MASNVGNLQSFRLTKSANERIVSTARNRDVSRCGGLSRIPPPIRKLGPLCPQTEGVPSLEDKQLAKPISPPRRLFESHRVGCVCNFPDRRAAVPGRRCDTRDQSC